MLDEACAHVQARARYAPATEALIRERRDLFRRVQQTAQERPAADAPRVREEPMADADDDPFERLARGGFAALERFGAELEAAFAGRPAPPAERAPEGPRAAPDAEEPRRATPNAPAPDARARLATVEWELQRRFLDEGVVVRGHDVARVVSAASGQRVEWKA
jgi:hypothetical protein